MQPGTERKMQVVFDEHQYRLSRREEQTLHDSLDALSRQVENFPMADLHVLVEGNSRSNEVSVKLSLMLPGTTLVTNDRDVGPQPAFERCLDSLVHLLHGYKDKLGQVAERQKSEKGTLQDVHTTVDIDREELNQAVDAGDFAAFRTLTFPLEENLRKRVGRWVQRYPEFQARIGKDVEIADVVEDIFLLAFEGYEQRPTDLSFGTWLENFIDPAIRALQDHPDEVENVRLSQAARAAEQGPGVL